MRTLRAKPASSAERSGCAAPLVPLDSQQGGGEPGRKGWGLPTLVPAPGFSSPCHESLQQVPWQSSHPVPQPRAARRQECDGDRSGECGTARRGWRASKRRGKEKKKEEGKGKGKAKLLQGRLHSVRKKKVPHAARRIGTDKSCLPLLHQRSAKQQRFGCWEGRGSPQDCRNKIQHEGGPLLHPRAHLGTRTFDQPKSGGKPLEHPGRCTSHIPLLLK